MPGGRFDTEFAANHSEAFLDAEQPQSTIAVSGRTNLGRVEAAAVVFDNCLNLSRGAAEDKRDMPGARMLGNIVQGFLHDAVKCRFNF
jgi:hypothetical protein